MCSTAKNISDALPSLVFLKYRVRAARTTLTVTIRGAAAAVAGGHRVPATWWTVF